MAVSANRKAQAGFVYTRESTAPYTGIPNLLQKVNIMQNNIPAQLIAAVAIPENHYQDVDAVSCRWQLCRPYPRKRQLCPHGRPPEIPELTPYPRPDDSDSAGFLHP